MRRQKKFKSLHGWTDHCYHGGFRQRRLTLANGDLFVKLYDPSSGRVYAEGTLSPAHVPNDPLWQRGATFMSELLKKAIAARKQAEKKATEFEPEAWMHKIPTVEQWLKVTTIDGKRRETSTITLMFDQGQCKVMFKDRQSHELAWSTADTFLEALIGLEERLCEGTVEWQEDRFHNPKNGKK